MEAFFLLKPFGNVVLGPKEVDQSAHPVGRKNNYTANDFAHKSDGLLDDVDNCQYGQYFTDDVNNFPHSTTKIAFFAK
jgi:hypothetical protein